ncbi:YveK family protein [Butyrivibrio sp. NC3005]|uniref:YveK family protein n=1 Tax=Butyrivibrio sp. NC3005 TaxID=1280685 RepID=UPI0003FE3EF0|nr:hypothetical protein [Butyrivibrio sp. NC3005]
MDIRVEDFIESFLYILKNIFACVLGGCIGFIAVILITVLNPVTNSYCASTTIYNAFYGESGQSSKTASIVTTYSSLVQGTTVCTRAASMISGTKLSAKDIQNMIGITKSTDDITLTVSAYSSDPALSVEIANAVSKSFAIEIKNMTGTDAVQILEPAQEAYVVSKGLTEVWKKRILGFAFGFVVVAAFYFCKEFFSGKIREASQCAISENDNIIAIIPKSKLK